MTSTTHDQPGAGRPVELVVGGMTCASCATRIERKLNKVDGVSATVNFATEKARVSIPDGLSTKDVIKVVQDTGYTATASPSGPHAVGGKSEAGASPTSTPDRCGIGC